MTVTSLNKWRSLQITSREKTFYKVKVLTKEPTLKYVNVSAVVEELFLEQESGNTFEKNGSGTFSTEEKQGSGTSSTEEIVISGNQGSLGDTEGELRAGDLDRA